MSQSLQTSKEYLDLVLSGKMLGTALELDELTLDVDAENLIEVATFLRDDEELSCEELIDLCAVDYLSYGQAEWDTQGSGFSRGVEASGAERFNFDTEVKDVEYDGKRFAVVYHLLSVSHNHRVRLRTWCEDNDFPTIDSVVEIWSSANWFEREAFDLYGVMFSGHPDLRRILTDYGFVGHPFRKDFPLVGHVEMRYDPEQQRVIYEPVSIEPRVLVPRVIRDNQTSIPPVEIDE